MTALTNIYLDECSLDYIPSTNGIDVQNFEIAIGKYLGVDKCVATNSGTSALFLALKACGVGKGDKVLVPATTFIATANAVSYTGARVVFTDVGEDTWCMHKVLVGKKIKAVVPVTLYGNYNMTMEGAVDKFYIIDAAENIDQLKQVGPFNAYCYSFNGNKYITTGGGGLIVGDNLDEIRQMINPGTYNGIGYNYGMTALSARLGLEQLKLLDSHKEKKTKFNQIYRENLKHRLTFQQVTGTPWMTAALWPKGTDIVDTQQRLREMGIPTRRVFEPLNHFKPYMDGKTYPVAEDIWRRGLCLPSSVRNSEEDIYEVCQKIKGLL